MAGSSRESAPVDFDVLEDMRKYLVKSARFREYEWRPDYAPDSLVCIYDAGLYPASVDEAYLQITWFKNDDFYVHYQENWADSDDENVPVGPPPERPQYERPLSSAAGRCDSRPRRLLFSKLERCGISGFTRGRRTDRGILGVRKPVRSCGVVRRPLVEFVQVLSFPLGRPFYRHKHQEKDVWTDLSRRKSFFALNRESDG